MNKTTILLALVVVAASGCVSDSTSPNQDANNPESNDNSPMNQDSVTTYTRGNESMKFILEADNSSEIFDFRIEQEGNITGNQYFSRYDSVNLTARVMCGAAQQIAYNYSNFASESQSSGIESSNTLSEGLSSSEQNSEDSELPEWVFEEFEAEDVGYTLTEESTSEEIATCEPTRENLNLDIKIEQTSENSEGLS
jgi:hypothetical protein